MNPHLTFFIVPFVRHTSDPNDPTLLPPKDPKHKNLWRRWKFFLENILSQDNQNQLADSINDALTDAKKPPYILFDVRQASKQEIIVSSFKDTGHDIPQITIHVVDAMPEHPSTPGGDDPPDLDSQA